MSGAGIDPPLTERGRRTAQLLREAARRAFDRHGFADTRVEDIVAEAGVSHGTFYTYYDNKAHVLDALLDTAEEAILAVADEPWDQADVTGNGGGEGGGDATGQVRGVLGRFVEVFADYADVIAAWLQATAHEAHFRERLRRVRAGYTDRIADQLRPVLADTPHDPSVAAAALVALVEGYATQGLATASDQQRAEAVDTLAAMWVGGVRELAAG